MKPRSAASALVESIRNPDLQDIATEAADVTLDAIVRSGALEAVPIIEWIVKGKKAASAIRDELFFRKVCRFLTPVASVSQEEREAFAKKVHDDTHRERIGEAFLLWLDKTGSMEKVVLLGRIFRAFIRGKVSLDEAVQLAEIVDHAYLPYLSHLAPSRHPPHSPGTPRDTAVLTHLTGLGLVQFEATWEAVDRQFKRDVSPRNIELLRYTLTPLAHRVSQVVLSDENNAAAV